MRWQPALRTVPPYHDDPAYIEAIAQSIENHLAGLDWEPEIVLASFHGIPQSYFLKGDPYHCQCLKTARLVRERLGWPKEKLMPTFQSPFRAGRMAAALYGQDRREACQGRRQAHCRDQPGLRFRLP
jgi:ferrochelatase